MEYCLGSASDIIEGIALIKLLFCDANKNDHTSFVVNKSSLSEDAMSEICYGTLKVVHLSVNSLLPNMLLC